MQQPRDIEKTAKKLKAAGGVLPHDADLLAGTSAELSNHGAAAGRESRGLLLGGLLLIVSDPTRK
jgi:hypothetical protein